MIRLLLHVEGRTELFFVNEILAPHLYALGFLSVTARLMGGARSSMQRGGVRPWESVRREIVNNLRTDSELIVSTMVDYYGMPPDWPGRSDASASRLPTVGQAALIENALLEDACSRLDRNFDPTRFMPYVMMHEFEAMLFSDCEVFSNSVGRSDLSISFQAIRDEFASPEDIDDSPNTAPSKRIEALLPEYQKPTMGIQAAQGIGLETIRRECQHFRDWLERLENLTRQ